MANIYNIHSNQSFFQCLIAGIIQRFGEENLDEIMILLPSRRACRDLRSGFLKYFSKKAHILPQIISIGDFDEEQIALSTIIDCQLGDLPQPALHSIEQQILLAKLIQEHHSLDMVSALALAYDLSLLLNELEKQNLEPEILDQLVGDDLAIHWQKILAFLLVLAKYWPEKISEIGKVSQTKHSNQLIDLQNDIWKKKPPRGKIIAAGSSGSVASTANLLKTISHLPNGMVILVGLDQDLDQESWNVIDEFHPQHHLKKLLLHLSSNRSGAKLWCDDHYLCSNERRKLISEILRSSSSGDHWSKIKQINDKALLDLHYIIADNPQHEASIIANILRSILESPDKSASLVTNDLDLATRVSSILTKFGIDLDNSTGVGFSSTHEMVFIRLVAKMVINNFSPIDFLSLFKHDLAHIEQSFISEIELLIFRGVRVSEGLEEILQSLIAIDRADLANKFKELIDISDNFIQLMEKPVANFKDLLLAHLALSEKLARKADEGSLLFTTNAGLQIVSFLHNLLEYASGLGDVKTSEYLGVLDNLLLLGSYRNQYTTHSRITISSPIEARFHKTDVIILGSLNEGNWPSNIAEGPWLNKAMRKQIGLSLLEKRIGRMSHDFYVLSCAKELYLTRSSKSGSAQTIPSRWLLRLETLLKKFDLSIYNPYWAKISKLIQQPSEIKPCQSPAPCPLLEYRPNKLSVTEIEKLLKDPYWIYARKILNLKKLEPVEADFSAADFGNFIHQALEIFTINYKDTPSNLWYDLLIATGNKILKKIIHLPVINSLWWPRFQRIAAWIIQRELDNYNPSHKIYSEIRGKIITKSFHIIAKADRIEIDQDGNITIIDYKTGSLPSVNAIKKALAPQLILECLIANEKGFPFQNPKDQYISHKIIYIRLTGGEIAGEEMVLETNLANLIEEARIGLNNLITAFSNQHTPYLASPLPDRILPFNDYEHLARNKEWLEG